MHSEPLQSDATDIGIRSPKFPKSVFFSAALIFLLFGLGPNSLLAFGSLLVLIAIVALVWRPGEVPILLYIFLYQWLETSIGIFYSNVHGITLGSETTSLGADRQLATVLCLIGLLVQSVGVRWVIGVWQNKDRKFVEIQLRRIPQRTWLGFYLAAMVLAQIAAFLAGLFPGLSQPLLSLVYLKWVAYVILTLSTFFRSDSSKSLWFVVFLLEIVLSLGDYFSSFKFVFIFTFLSIATVQTKFSVRMKFLLGAVAIVALVFGSVWSSIKSDYRNFVSLGQQAQIVKVDYLEQITKLAELISPMDWVDLLNGFDILARRIEYVEYFGEVIGTVPKNIPHSDGELWLDAVRRPFMPRLFFQDKAIIDESLLTNLYVTSAVAGMGDGTQISLGYIAESYIDFGKYGMMLPMLLWGMILGWTYRRLLQNVQSRGVLGFGMTSALFLLTSSSIGNSAAKLFGGFVVTVIVFWLFNRYVAGVAFPWIREQPLVERGMIVERYR